MTSQEPGTRRQEPGATSQEPGGRREEEEEEREEEGGGGRSKREGGGREEQEEGREASQPANSCCIELGELLRGGFYGVWGFEFYTGLGFIPGRS